MYRGDQLLSNESGLTLTSFASFYKRILAFFQKNNNFFWALFLSNSLYVTYASVHLNLYGYLPPPLFYMPFDTFMDFYNTNFWAVNGEMYSVWRSIYSPFVFLIGKLLSPDYCGDTSFGAVMFRDCSSWTILFLIALLIAGVGLCARYIYNFNSAGFWVAFFGLLSSLPSIFSLERGNYIVFAFFLLSLLLYTRKVVLVAILLAAAINIKQYLLPLMFSGVNRRSLSLPLLTSIFSAVLFVGAGQYIDDDYTLMLDNMMVYSDLNYAYSKAEKLYYIASYTVLGKIGKEFAGGGLVFASYIYAVTLFVFAAYGFAVFFIKKNCFDEMLVFFYLLLFIIVAVDSAYGYSIILLYPFMAYIFKHGNLWIGRVSLFLILTPIDFMLGFAQGEAMGESYLSSQFVSFPTGITALSLIRPMVLLYSFIHLTLNLKRYQIVPNETLR